MLSVSHLLFFFTLNKVVLHPSLGLQVILCSLENLPVHSGKIGGESREQDSLQWIFFPAFFLGADKVSPGYLVAKGHQEDIRQQL